MTATRARRRTLLLESEGLPKGKVDRAAKVIRGVKIIGRVSKNGRRYTKECLERAIGLYEGKPVYFWHGKKAGPRTGVQPAGWLEGVRYEQDGLYGDLHYMESHPLCASLLEAAERNPSLWCLSHNAHGDARKVRGGEEITDILEVHSVDLVERGATTTGLFESEGKPVTLKLKDFVGALTLKGKHAKARKALLEYADGETPMPEEMEAPAEDAPAADHTAALADGFMASIAAIAQASISKEMDEGEASKKIAKLLKAHGKLSSDGAADDEEEEPLEEEEEEECAEDGKPMKESAVTRRRIKELEAREACRELLEEMGVKASKPLLTALVKLDKDEDRRELLEEWGDRPAPARKPITQKAGGKGNGGAEIKDTEGFVKALVGGAHGG